MKPFKSFKNIIRKAKKRMEYSDKKIESVNCYIKIIKNLYKDDAFLGKDKNNDIFTESFFFRGLPKKEYKLIPTIFREYTRNKKIKERSVLLNYRDNLPRMQNKHLHFIKDRLELLVDMQHYGLPTRLLDWTMDPLIALYFAVREENPPYHSCCYKEKCPQDAVVWGFNPWNYQANLRVKSKNGGPNWVEMSKLARALLPSYDYKNLDQIKNILKVEFYGDNVLQQEDIKYPFPLIAKYQNPRIIHQTGAFTIHGTCEDAFEDINDIEEKYLKKITIPRDMKKSILEELWLLFINEYTVFPDMEGMQRQITQNRSLYDVQKNRPNQNET